MATTLVVAMVGCLMLAGAAAAQAGTIIVARRGWHIDVGFPVGDLEQPLSFTAGEFPGARYVFFGFGDRRYLMDRHRRTPLMMLALLPGPGLILGTGLAAAPVAAFGRSQVIVLPMPRNAALRAQAFVWRSMTDDQESALRQRDAANRGPVGIPGPYEGSSFFETRARYSAGHTCNTWAAEMLAQAGVPVQSRGTVFAGQLWRQLERISEQHPTLGSVAVAARPLR